MSQEDVINSKKLIKKLSSQKKPLEGWIKYWRQRLGLTTTELGQRSGYDQPRISRLEKAEVKGDLMLSTLIRIAEGLDMQFVYGFIPKEKSTVKKQPILEKKKRDSL